eukprot:TRINITY_DN8127_c0_g1_i1.p1 TRINITY_DN8127_c0_g1~~TRINITY_DN8127_c0_g1_i1.p1  ORF type:complete len:528 (-),score=79.35 TRINITY_DN8127_c0_g1_i1:458-2041(-)
MYMCYARTFINLLLPTSTPSFVVVMPLNFSRAKRSSGSGASTSTDAGIPPTARGHAAASAPSRSITIACVGRTGEGKSTLAKNLARRVSASGDCFEESAGASSHTHEVRSVTAPDGSVTIIDTPGLLDSKGRETDRENMGRIVKHLRALPGGVHVLVMCMQTLRFDDSLKDALDMFYQSFGALAVYRHLVLAFTRCSMTDDEVRVHAEEICGIVRNRLKVPLANLAAWGMELHPERAPFLDWLRARPDGRAEAETYIREGITKRDATLSDLIRFAGTFASTPLDTSHAKVGEYEAERQKAMLERARKEAAVQVQQQKMLRTEEVKLRQAAEAHAAAAEKARATEQCRREAVEKQQKMEIEQRRKADEQRQREEAAQRLRKAQEHREAEAERQRKADVQRRMEAEYAKYPAIPVPTDLCGAWHCANDSRFLILLGGSLWHIHYNARRLPYLGHCEDHHLFKLVDETNPGVVRVKFEHTDSLEDTDWLQMTLLSGVWVKDFCGNFKRVSMRDLWDLMATSQRKVFELIS